MKEDEDTYMAVVESIRLMAQIHLVWWPFVCYACLRLWYAVVHFIRNNYVYFVCCGWSGQALTALATLPAVSVAW